METAPEEEATTSIGATIAAMLYADRAHRPEQRLFHEAELLVVRDLGGAELVHLGRDAIHFGQVERAYEQEGRAHRDALLAIETAAEAVSEMKLSASVPWSEITRVRLEREALIVVHGEREHRVGVKDVEATLEPLRAHLPSFASVEVKRPRREILKDAGCLTALAVGLWAATAALGGLLSMSETLVGLAPYVVGGGEILLGLFAAVMIVGTVARLWRPETVVELRPRETGAAYR